MEQRTINGQPITLEAPFWEAIEMYAREDRKPLDQWVAIKLSQKPDDVPVEQYLRAEAMRIAILKLDPQDTDEEYLTICPDPTEENKTRYEDEQ